MSSSDAGVPFPVSALPPPRRRRFAPHTAEPEPKPPPVEGDLVEESEQIRALRQVGWIFPVRRWCTCTNCGESFARADDCPETVCPPCAFLWELTRIGAGIGTSYDYHAPCSGEIRPPGAAPAEERK